MPLLHSSLRNAGSLGMSNAPFKSVVGGSTISRLPVELLDRIFLFAVSHSPAEPIIDDLEEDFDDGLKQSRALSHVSNRWRAVAIANPYLWNEIHLARWWKRERISWIKEILQRSRRADVSLHIQIGGGWSEVWDEILEPLFLDVISRIYELEVQLDYSLLHRASRIIECFCNNTLPQLEKLEITPSCLLTDPRRLRQFDFHFNRENSKLRHVIFKLNYDYIPLSMLSNVTHFKLTPSSSYGNPGLTLERCVRLLRAMPLLEELDLCPIFDDLGSDIGSDLDDWNDGLVVLPLLKQFKMNAYAENCALFLPSMSVPPGCAVQVTCIDSELDNAYMTVLKEVVRLAEQSGLDTRDRTLEIDVRTNLISVVVNRSFSGSRGFCEPHLFEFTVHVKKPRVEADQEPQLAMESIHYVFFILVARALLYMKLNQAAEIVLRVNSSSTLEKEAAPVIMPLLRACESAKKLHLTGVHNEFMIPVLSHMMYGTGKDFGEPLFGGLDLVATSPGSWDSTSVLQYFINKENWPSRSLVRSTLEPQTFGIVNFLHTSFDVTTADGVRDLSYILSWKESQIRMQDDLILSITHGMYGRSKYGWLPRPQWADDMTMAHVMHEILKPKIPEPPSATQSWLLKIYGSSDNS